eukprot:scaffold94352_cov77-Phaeocystis_antarctica.AAC.1
MQFIYELGAVTWPGLAAPASSLSVAAAANSVSVATAAASGSTSAAATIASSAVAADADAASGLGAGASAAVLSKLSSPPAIHRLSEHVVHTTLVGHVTLIHAHCGAGSNRSQRRALRARVAPAA